MKSNCRQRIFSIAASVAVALGSFSSAAFAEKTYLHIAMRDTKHPATVEEVERILDRCPQWINEADEFDTTALHLACGNGKEDIAKLLIDRGADLSAKARVIGKGIEKDEKIVYWTPLIWASYCGHAGIVRYLLAHGAEVNAYDKTTLLAPIHFAAKNGHLEVLRALCEKGVNVDDWGNFLSDKRVSPLCLAARYSSFQVVDYLISKGANVNFKDSDNWTPLHYAVLAGSLPTVQSLVEHGACVNDVCGSNDQYSPLHCAANSGYLDIAKYLVEKGADVNLANNIGQTPLHVAVKTKHADVAEFLVSKGSYSGRKDNSGKTPEEIAVESKDWKLAQYLKCGH